jgi:anti-repressor protein
MNELKIFNNTEFGKLSVNNTDNGIYFFLEEVCRCLGYTKQAKGNTYLRKDKIVNICESLEIKGLSPSDNFETITLNADFDNVRITEDALYDLILESKAKNARKFRKWITSEILPQIRKTGGYIPVKEDEPDELIMARAVQIANETIKHKDEIIANQKKRIKSLEETEKDWKLLMDTKGTFSINEIAHFIGIGEYRLFSYMRNIGLLFKNENGDNVPYENVVNRTKFISVPAIAPDGTAHVQTRVKPDGISYITKLLRKYGYLEVA